MGYAVADGYVPFPQWTQEVVDDMVVGSGGWARVPAQHGARYELAQLSRQTLLGVYGIGQYAFGAGEEGAGFHGDRALPVQGDQAWVVVVEECLYST